MPQTSFHGKDAILRLGVGDEANLCATRGLSIGLTSDTVDVTSRCDAEHGFTNHIASWKTWTISTDGVFIANSTSLQTLFNAYMSGEPFTATIELPDDSIYTGQVIATSFDVDAPYDDAITFTSELQGAGILNITQPAGMATPAGSAEIKMGLSQMTEKEKK